MGDPSLIFLSQIRDNLAYADIGLIKQSIADLKNKFAPVAILKKGHYIDRVRINNGGEIFTRKDQVNYITDLDKLNNYVSFGRANFPGQSIFYGAVPSPQIRLSRGTAYLETTDFFAIKPIPNNFSEIFTLSRWTILADVQVMEIIFSDEALKISEYVKKSFESQTAAISDHKLKDHFLAQGKFFSNEFSRDDCRGMPDNYKISSAYANYVWKSTSVKGVTFPSVRTEFKGQNVALMPEIVDKYLKLEIVGLFKFERKDGINLPIDSIKIAKDLGMDQINFKWIDYVGKEQQQSF